MNSVIWKFPLPMVGEGMIEMPRGAAVLTVQTQGNEPMLWAPMLWAEVDPKAPKIKRRFVIYGTGHPMQGEPMSYVATFQMNGGQLAFHVYTDRIEYTD